MSWLPAAAGLGGAEQPGLASRQGAGCPRPQCCRGEEGRHLHPSVNTVFFIMLAVSSNRRTRRHRTRKALRVAWREREQCHGVPWATASHRPRCATGHGVPRAQPGAEGGKHTGVMST